jgi:hypothetical protein
MILFAFEASGDIVCVIGSHVSRWMGGWMDGWMDKQTDTMVVQCGPYKAAATATSSL